MTIDLDDDDTIPTANATVLHELAGDARGVVARRRRLGRGDVGRARAVASNEDAWGRRDGIFAVADGMGGRGGGTLAARTSIDRFLARSEAAGSHPDWRTIVEAVNVDVLDAAAAHGIDRVGTTLLASIVGGPLVTLVHLGDSRAYRLAGTGEGGWRLDQLTHDHNVRAELLAAGLDVRDYRDRGVALHGLTSFIGLEHDVLRIDVLAVPVRAGDRILLCTDGIYRQLDEDALRAALGQGTARQAAEALVDGADHAGGKDNSTALVVGVGVTGHDG